MAPNKPRRCPFCRQAELQQTTRSRTFHPHKNEVRVELLTSVCPACNKHVTTGSQHAENLRRLKARKAEYGELLLGSEIFALRRRYGITQQKAATIFGKGKIAFSRYENETSYPDKSTTKLLTLALENPAIMRRLADTAGVDLPLWEARCAEHRQQTLRIAAQVDEQEPTRSAWVARQAFGPRKAPGQALPWDDDAMPQRTASNDTQFTRTERRG